MPSSVQHLERSAQTTVYFLSANKGLRETLWHFFLGKTFSDLTAFLKSEFGERLELNSVNMPCSSHCFNYCSGETKFGRSWLLGCLGVAVVRVLLR